MHSTFNIYSSMVLGFHILTCTKLICSFNLEMGKLQLSFLNSIQICRPKDASSLVINPLPALTYFSKTYDISLPDPPLSPPQPLSTKCNVGSSKIVPLGCTSRPKSCATHGMTSSQAYSRTKNQDKENFYDSSFSSETNEGGAWHIAPSRIDKRNAKALKKKPKAKNNTSISLADDDENRSPHGHGSNNSPSTTTGEEGRRSVRQRSVRTTRFKRFGSKEWKDGSIIESKNESGRLEERRVKQSYIVVKRSADPCEDFKKSMLEMIVEKQMFEPKELEQLLMSFLSLNSRMHHKAILKAFTQIWKEVFT